MQRLTYRPDIDGLRAIAVLLVVAYHAFPNWMSGGFVGVDVFFVISGFLISSIIVSEIRANRFSILGFYARRVRRIFPALLVVLCASAIIFWHVLLPHQFRAFSGHLISSALFFPNFAFWKETGYFAPAGETLPLLHLWSLGIEEQFYLVFPLAAVVVLPLGSRRWLSAILLALVISFFLALFWSYYRPSQAFYFPIFRAWEFLVGVALATIPARQHPAGAINRFTANALTCVGLCLIIFAGVDFIPSDIYPGWRALIPVIGTALCICEGPRSNLSRLLLTAPLFVAIGLISYPFYLWHWPLLVLGNIVGLNEAAPRAALVALAFGLAILTYRFVEIPIRQSRAKPVAASLLAGMAFVSVAGLSAWSGYLASPNETPALHAISAAATDFVNTRSTLPPLKTDRASVFSKLGQGPTRVLMIGDSNMEQYFPRVEKLSQSQRLPGSIVFATIGGCPPIPGAVSTIEPNCTSFVADAFAFARKPEVKRVVISAAWYGYFNGSASHQIANPEGTQLLSSPLGLEAAISALGSELTSLQQAGKRVFLILNIPFGAEFEPMTRLRHTWTGSPFASLPIDATRQDVVMRSGPIRERLKILGSRSGVEIIDPLDVLCEKERCSPVDDQQAPIYKDAGHLRAEYVRNHATFIDRIILDP